jgi:hypothetical protein
MRLLVYMTLSALLLLQGCAVFQPQKPTPASTDIKNPKAAELLIHPTTVQPVLEWGTPLDLPVDVAWKSGQKLAVQLAPAADTPKWLTVDIQPAIIDPPTRVTVRLSAAPGEAIPGDYTVILEGSAFGFNQPVPVEIAFTLRRQAGEFAPLLAGTVSIECRGICGTVADGQVNFYDVLREKDQFCNDSYPLPESQRIGPRGFALSDRGFGYGRTCKLAGIYESSGMFSIINLGLSPRLPRGAVLLTLRGVSDCWFSPDNTIALITIGEAVQPYDVLTGKSLARPCRNPAKTTSAALHGDSLTAGPCSWVIR